jgi:hypothetical protein
MDIHDEQLKNFFRPGRNIHPSESFREQSLGLILSRTQKQPSFPETIRREFLENMKFSLALGLAAVFVFIALGSLSNWGGVMPGGATRANNELLSEAASLEFQIELGKAEYFTQSADEIALMVESLKNSETNNEALNIILEGRVF